MVRAVTRALTTLIRVGLLSLILATSGCVGDWNDWWLTSDQQAQRWADSGDHAAAAQLYSDPMRSGTQWYRAGEFERAAAEFGRLETADAYFNRGNALVFQGKYESAIQMYERALKMQPNRSDAEENRQLAEVRKAALEPPDDDAGGHGRHARSRRYRFRSGRKVQADTGRANRRRGGRLTRRSTTRNVAAPGRNAAR